MTASLRHCAAGLLGLLGTATLALSAGQSLLASSTPNAQAAPVAQAMAASAPAQPARTPAAKSQPTSRPDDVKKNMHQLMLSSITAPAGSQALEDLPGVIRQLQALEPAAKSAPPRESPRVPVMFAHELPMAQSQPAEPAPRTVDGAMLGHLMKAPTQCAVSPIQLGDSLFSSGQLDAACALYQVAAQQADANKAETLSWAKFQMANCLREKDPNAARDLFRRVAADYPESPWAAIAAEQDRQIEWEQTNRPRAVLSAMSRAQTRPALQAANRPLEPASRPTE